jgi:hypothetical protein
MFRSKRVSVQPGDVFLETLGREKSFPSCEESFLLRAKTPPTTAGS